MEDGEKGRMVNESVCLGWGERERGWREGMVKREGGERMECAWNSLRKERGSAQRQQKYCSER